MKIRIEMENIVLVRLSKEISLIIVPALVLVLV